MECRISDAGQPAAQNGSTKGLEQEAEAPALCLRLLCPQILVPALIGKKGDNIKRIRRESGATVSVADAVAGCEERVVHITGERLDAEASTSAADALCSVFCSISSLQQQRRGEVPAAVPPSPPPPPAAGSEGSEGDASAGNEAAARDAANGDSTAAAPDGDGASVASGDGAEASASAEGAGDTAAQSDAPSSSNGAAAAAAAGASGAASASDDSGATTPTAAAAAAAAAATGGPAAAPAAGSSAAAPALQLQRLEAKMLVDSSLVGFLVGRGGATIKETMAKSGAAVRILSKAELPACASKGEEVIRVNGSAAAVQAALRLLAGQLKAHPPRSGGHRHPSGPDTAIIHGSSGGGRGGGGGGAGHHQKQQQMLTAGMAAGGRHAMDPSYMQHQHQHPSAGAMASAGGGGGGGGGFYSAGSGGGMPAFGGTPVEATFRLLAPVTRTGNIIGKGGEHVRRVRAETGARIKVFDPSPGSEERVVALTSTEDALSPYCAAQDGLIRCVIALTADDSPAALHRVRLLTAQASVGMVLGKRGATVSQLRHETGAGIKVVPSEAIAPAFGGGLGSEDESEEDGSPPGSVTAEEVIQVEGSVQQCVAALRGVATLLRGWQIRRLLAQQQQDQERHYGGMAGAAMMQQHSLPQHSLPQPVPISPTAGSIMSPGSPGIMGLHLPSTLNSPVQPGSYMMPSGMHHLQSYPSQQGHMPGMLGGGGSGPAGHQQQRGGGGRGVQYVYHLSNAQVGAVLGKGGAHIAQIRGMSGARVQLQGELDGGGRALTVAGQLEQCHAAHSMANAFLSMGRCDPAYPQPI